MGITDVGQAAINRTLATLLDKYDGDLAAATPEELTEASQLAWEAALLDAQAEHARRAQRPDGRPIGGLADICDSIQGTPRARIVESFLLTVTDVERLMLEIGSYFERVATDADLWISRDPAAGFDGDDVKRLQEERTALYTRMQSDAAQIASRADRLRTML